VSTPSPVEPPRRDTALFRPRATTLFRVALLAVPLLLAATGYTVFAYFHSPYWNGVGVAPSQPVLFSHRHHAGELGIDCRYCHTTVERSAFAGMPTTQTCLTCHSQLFTDTPMLQPVVASAQTGRPLHWQRVTHLPDHVYFDHSIHLAKGVGCTTCHGPVGELALTAKQEPLTMRWCIDCHRDPGPRLRPAAGIFAASAVPPRNTPAQADVLLRAYDVHRSHLTNCTTCHH